MQRQGSPVNPDKAATPPPTATPRPNSDPEAVERFLQNREKIQYLLIYPTLRKKVDEFYKVQREFHLSMSNLVAALSELSKEIDDKNEYPIEQLLLPYKTLVTNPFHEAPTGNLEEDIDHIIKVVNDQNNEFKHALIALKKCIVNKTQMNKLMEYLKSNPEISQKIQAQLGETSWMMVEGQADKPFQLLMRYELLLNAIHTTLLMSRCKNIESILRGLMSSVEFLVPEVKQINDHLGTIMVLNNIEHTMKALLTFDKVKNALPIKTNEGEITIKTKIEFIVDCARTGKKNILANEQDIHLLYKVLLELLIEIDAQLTLLAPSGVMSYLTREAAYNGYSALYATFFGSSEDDSKKPFDPTVEIKAIIAKLKVSVEQIEIIKHYFGKK